MLATAESDVSANSRTKRTHYQIVHQNERRIRLLVSRLAEDKAYASQLKFLIESVACVTNVRINPAATSIAIEYDYQASAGAIAQAKARLFEAIDQAALAELAPTPIQAPPESQELNYWQRLGLPAIGLGVALLASPLDLPFLLVGGLIAGAAMPIFHRAIAGISEERQIKVDVLDSLWITLQALTGQYIAPALMVSLLASGELVRDVTARANEDETLKLLDLSERHVWVERDGQQHHLPLQEVQKGDCVIVYPDELIPVDGRILYGTALVDEHPVNGKTTLVAYSEGQKVYASTLVVKGQLCVLAERTGEQTRAALLAQFLKAVPIADTPTGDKAQEVSDRLVIPTLFLSGSLLALTGNISGALAPLQLDFGTGIRIAVQTTILAALTNAARCGVFIRNGQALEALASIDTVVIGVDADKTDGQTLPEQKIEVIRRLHDAGKTVAYVGDELSDTQALADADVSISFAQGTELEWKIADVVILDNDLTGLMQAIAIAKRAMEIVEQNITLIAVPNIGVVLAGIFFGLDPIASVIINNCTVLIAELNGRRPLSLNGNSKSYAEL